MQKTNAFFLKIKALIRPISHLVFPEKCTVCGNELNDHQIDICAFCQVELPYTFFEKMTNPNPLHKIFWGRCNIIQAFSMLYFEKNNATSKLVHAIKYENKSELAKNLGRLMALRVQQLNETDKPEALIPIPLHPRRKFERGYNQSEQLCIGFKGINDLPILKNGLKRIKNVQTQTKLNRFERWKNVNAIFSVDEELGKYKHVALVDDVITTGSTLEAAYNEISKNYPEIRISIISLALAK